MSTIKELAETCGVSEQAIRKWCARNQVAKDVAQRYIIVDTPPALAVGSVKAKCRQSPNLPPRINFVLLVQKSLPVPERSGERGQSPLRIENTAC